jgi:uncharacterized membrane protein
MSQKVQNVKVHWKTHSGNMKPWSDFFDFRRFSRPQSGQHAVDRIQHNLHYFYVNYALVAAVFLVIVLLNHLSLLFVALGLLAGYVYVASLPTGYSFNLGAQSIGQKQLFLIWTVVSVILLWWTSAGDALFWWILFSGVSFLIHASILEKSIDSEFLNGQNV